MLAWLLPNEIPECWRVQCIIEGYNELLKRDKDKKEQIKEVKEQNKTKFEYKTLRGKKK